MKKQAKTFFIFVGTLSLIIAVSAIFTGCKNLASECYEVSNSAFLLRVTLNEPEVHVVLEERQIPQRLSEGNYIYRAQVSGSQDTIFTLQNPAVTVSGRILTIRGILAGLDIEHSFYMPSDKPFLEEHIVLHNPGNMRIALSEFEMGFPLNIIGKGDKIIPELINDRLIAIPFRHRADDKNGVIHDYSLTDIIEKPGWEYRPTYGAKFDQFNSRHHFSDGWAWIHGKRSVGIFSFNQENMVYSVLSPVKTLKRTLFRFGGACFLPIHSQPSALNRINPGDTVDLGVMRYQSIAGGYNEVAYSFRKMLDEKGCRFPSDYNPPIHWEQLYDMEGAWNNRIRNYTKARVEKEAVKGVEYSCESLYLDPGWDTKFGTFLWGEEWLGPRKKFIEEMQSKYGLKVSLHTPMPPWTSSRGSEMGPNCVSDWPAESRQLTPSGTLNDTLTRDWIKNRPEICMGSKSFMDEAEKRLLANCEDGVSFLMYDGTGWTGPCSDLTHGHPVPYLQEDHMRNCIELVKRVHEKYPNVLIELHDMLDGGSPKRMTPVYYKYGLPLSYDDNWGFELMWNPMEDIKQGRGLAMYYYNLACNIPIYLHIDLRKDNDNCVMLWWFASTARHLGIGGTHKDVKTVEAQKAAMKYYKQFDRFYKRGEFYGITEEIHLHILPEENAFMVNIFNLSDNSRIITGKFDLRRAGLDPNLTFKSSKSWAKVDRGILEVNLEMPPWSAEVTDIKGVISPREH
ncbi:hypothetical protein ES708_05715 [subsurface metagenome]